MESRDSVLIEDSFAKAILMEGINNDAMKKSVADAASLVSQKVFQPIVDIVNKHKGNLDEIKKESPSLFNSVNFLIDEHSNKSNQRLGLYKEMSPDAIKKDPNLIVELVNQVQKNLLTNPTDELEMDKKIKAICEGGFCYVEHFSHDKNKDEFTLTKNLIMPSEEEARARIMRTEKGEPETVARTTGIGKEKDKDVVEKSKAQKSDFGAGKAAFFGVSTLERAEMMVKKYDDLQAKIETTKAKNEDTTALETQQLASLDFMRKYRIPLEKDKRENLGNYVKPSTIERLANLSSLPLIATSSGTEGRALVMLYDLEAFGKGDKFNFDNAQMVSNYLSASILYGGHHSYIELVEPFNRLLDVVGINALEKGDLDTAKKTIERQIPVVAIKPEERFEFVHKEIKDNVREQAKALINNVARKTL